MKRLRTLRSSSELIWTERRKNLGDYHGSQSAGQHKRRQGRRDRQRPRVVRLFCLRVRRCHHRQEVFPLGRRCDGTAVYISGLRVGVHRASSRRRPHWTLRRHPRSQGGVVVNDLHDGCRHGASRPAADIRYDRFCGAAAAGCRTPHAGLLRWGRMGRLDSVHRRVGAEGRARLVRQFSANERCRGIAARLWSGGAFQYHSYDGANGRLGLARSVPARRNPRAGRHVHAPHHEGDAGLRGRSP